LIHLCTSATLRIVQIRTRLSGGLAVATIVAMGLYGASELHREAQDLKDVAERGFRLTARAVEAAVGNALRDGRAGDVAQTIDAVVRQDSSLKILVLDAGGGLISAPLDPQDRDSVVQRALADAQHAGAPVVRFEGAGGLSHIAGIFPISGERSTRRATLIVIRSLDDVRRDLANEARATLVSLTILAVGLAAAGWLMASVYVRAPLQNLLGAMRIGPADDHAADAAPGRNDEIGAVLSEFKELIAELAEARGRLVAEAAARQGIETSLRRADKLVTAGQLSAGLAHEIGSPLQILNGRARALAERPNVPPDVRRTAEILARESQRIARIVEQLLVFTRQAAPSIAAAALAGPVRDIVELLEPDARQHGVRLELRCVEALLPRAQADAGQIQQVVMNLVSNAVRATPPGGQVSVSLAGASPRGPEGEFRPCVELTVEDTGDGIPEAILPRIFEPFFTTRSHSGGTGLGLAVVKSLVDAHGGTIAVAPGTHRGTRFTVHIPALPAIAGGSLA
jgi:signal transduction histidine kinase